MPHDDDEARELLAVALRNAESIARARQRAEEELLRSKQALEETTRELANSLSMLRATLEATADGILVTDRAGRVTDFNERYCELWRLPSTLCDAQQHRQLIELTSRRFVDPASYAARIAEIEQGGATDAVDVLELDDGSVFERASRTQRVDGVDVGRVWSFRDVTERRRIETALLDESRVLDLLNKTGASIASTLDVREALQAVTDSATQLSDAAFGAFFYNVKGENGDAYMLYALSGAPREAFARFDPPRATPLFGPTFAGERTIRCADVRADPRYGQWAPHHGMPPGHLPVRSYLAVPVVSRSREVIGGLFFGHPDPGVFSERSERLVVGIAAYATIAIDNARLYEQATRLGRERESLLEAERQARAATERANRLKDDFLTTLSHELRTPLTAILGWSTLLMRKRDDENLTRGLEAITRNAKAQAQLVDDLLDMSRIVSGKVRLDVQPTDLANVVEAALDVVRPSADAKEIRLRKILDPRAGPVSGDPHRLQQVVWNLLSNAVKFTPKGGTIDVRLERRDSHLDITVADSGSGIAAEFLPQVFDRFAQSDSSSTRKHGGLGLGLSIVKHLVELHGGSVRAASAGNDRGATFVVSLPLAAVRGHGVGEPADARVMVLDPGELRLDGVKVLVVDDDADARELIRLLLEQHRAEVDTAASAREGLQRLRESAPQVIISDIGMPETDGYEFIRQVRRLPAASGGNTPAIALTAFARSEDRTRAMLAGYQMHVAKPIEPHELAATVRSLARRIGATES